MGTKELSKVMGAPEIWVKCVECDKHFVGFEGIFENEEGTKRSWEKLIDSLDLLNRSLARIGCVYSYGRGFICPNCVEALAKPKKEELVIRGFGS